MPRIKLTNRTNVKLEEDWSFVTFPCEETMVVELNDLADSFKSRSDLMRHIVELALPIVRDEVAKGRVKPGNVIVTEDDGYAD